MWQPGWKRSLGENDICVCMGESFCCPPETITTLLISYVVVQSLSCVWLFVTPWTAAYQASLFFTISWSLPKFMSIQLSHPLSPPTSPPAFNLSQHQGLFQWVSFSHQVAKAYSISPTNEYSGLIFFRIDCLISLLSKGLSRAFSSTTTQKHQLFGTRLSLWSNSHICTWLLEKS